MSRITRRCLAGALSCALILLLPAHPAQAGDRPPERPIRVYLDCVATRCDFDYLRTEIGFVDYVRTREDADLHVLVTSQRAGSGLELTLRFLGVGRFAGEDDELRFVSSDTDTSDERRSMLARMLALGLIRYALDTAAARDLRVVSAGEEPPRSRSPGRSGDPWNFWVFRTRLAGRVDAESSVSAYGVNAALSANRTTERWKIDVSGDAAYTQGDYDLGDDKPYRSVSRRSGIRLLLVRSLGGQLSAGLRASATASTYLNLDFAGRAAPAIEYNVFPYADSTRRRLTLQYAVGVRRLDYDAPSVFGLDGETRWDHSGEVSLDLKQPWGTLNTSFDVAQYLHDTSKYRLTFDQELDIRLFRGLSLNLNSEAAVIRDQIYLPAGDATAEEILVRQRQLETGYRYELSVGLSYTFGSIFNNVVNRRFGG